MVEKSTTSNLNAGFQPLGMPFGFDALMEMNRPALAAVADFNGRIYENLVEMNKEWTAFITRRLKEDLAMPQQLASCKTMQDMYGVYTDFFQKAVAQYQAEFTQMARLGKSLADDTLHSMQSHLEEAASERRLHN
jgi:hypothetical protein